MSPCLICGREARRTSGRGRPPRYCLSCQGKARSRLARGLCVRCAEPHDRDNPVCEACVAPAEAR